MKISSTLIIGLKTLIEDQEACFLNVTTEKVADVVEIEIRKVFGRKGLFGLHLRVGGTTILRIHTMTESQIIIMDQRREE